MKKTIIWVHTQSVYEKEGQEDLVVEGMYKKGEISFGDINTSIECAKNGWKRKSTKTWETEQSYYLPRITGKFINV